MSFGDVFTGIGVPQIQNTLKESAGSSTAALLNFRGEWDCTFAYAPFDAVIFNGAAYICVQAIAAPANADPLGWAVPVKGRLGSAEVAHGVVRTTDAQTVGDPQPGGFQCHAHDWTVNVTTVGTFTLVVAGGDTSLNNVPGPQIDIFSQATLGNVISAIGKQNSPFNATLSHLGIHNIIVRASMFNFGNPVQTNSPVSYRISLTNNTGVLGPSVCNTTPDLDFATWTDSGI